ncbi:hypothetical protein S40285_04010 [Stachybotrys chlorohalonatus IBT 40285]|uniref:Uncharacterized protein n=1 Tax=Stachybotrys chlorohalonatus (strain IBT 40285) TaxID=1283841 RepID=A0A084QC76_STAC4|nr:hypothetical protein S40285_04010 [Stachybotrys chlorohalonata IBT 40285]
MSKVTDNIKAGLKGIRGAGDVIRGEALDAADRAFDNPNHPANQANAGKNRTIAEQGRQDLRDADEAFARREWERKGVAPPSSAADPAPQPGTHSGVTAASVNVGAPPLPERHAGTTAATNNAQGGGYASQPGAEHAACGAPRMEGLSAEPGYNQPRSNQSGFNQPGYNQPEYNQPGYNQPEFHQPGAGQPGYRH